MEHFADRFTRAVADKGSPVCVGLDPVYAHLPDELRRPDASAAEEIESLGLFCTEVLKQVAPQVPAVKIQSAYFELCGPSGVDLYFQMVRAAQELGLLVIGDVKRNDIGSTAAAYAAAHLGGPVAPDAITVNGYLGADGIEPFAEVAEQNGQGVFVLVRTSNPSAPQVQDIRDGDGRAVYERMAELVASLGRSGGRMGQCGYSCVGAVVGATYPDEARQLRELMPEQVFLIPGYGAQGASAADCAASFKPDGSGGIVNASRSVLFAHTRKEYADRPWRQAVAAAAEAFARDIREAVVS